MQDALSYKPFSNSVLQGFKELPEREAIKLINSDLINLISMYLDKRINEDIAKADAWMKENEELKELLSEYNLNTEILKEIADSSAIGVVDLKKTVKEKAKQIIEKLVTEWNKELFCWLYLKGVSGIKTTNAWVTASCLYSLWKANIFLEPSGHKEEIENIIKNTIEWLLSESVLHKSQGMTGWSNNNIYADNLNHSIKLHDTAYVLNILLRIAPEKQKECEPILQTLLEWPSFNQVGWLMEDNFSLDIAGTSYCLRAISNYLTLNQKELLPRHLDNEEKINLFKIQRSACISILRLQNPEGYWPSKYDKMTKQATTALAIHALRSAGRPRDWQVILSGCTWIINRLRYLGGNWCWAAPDKITGEKKPSVYESSLCISALLKGSTFENFSRAQAVILWMLESLENTYKENPFDIGSILCTFADYLRSFKEEGFFTI